MSKQAEAVGERRKVTFTLPSALVQRLAVAAAYWDATQGSIVEEALHERLRDVKPLRAVSRRR